MNQEIKEEWATRCEDPNRKQAHNVLRDNEGRQCCLDILMEMGVEAGIVEAPELYDDMYKYISVMIDGSGREYYSYEYEILTQEVAVWAGLVNNTHPSNPYIVINDSNGDKLETSLSNLNDELGYSLPEIGKFIRESDL